MRGMKRSHPAADAERGSARSAGACAPRRPVVAVTPMLPDVTALLNKGNTVYSFGKLDAWRISFRRRSNMPPASSVRHNLSVLLRFV
jgi:hypothetical protein